MAFTGMTNWKKDNLEIPKSKVCKGCKQDKELKFFYRKRERMDGRSEKCKVCEDARIKAQNERKKAERDLYGFI